MGKDSFLIWKQHGINQEGYQFRFFPHTPILFGCSKRGKNQYPQDISLLTVLKTFFH